MKVYGALESAKIESVGALPTAGNKGRLVLLTTNNLVYYDDGTTFQEFALMKTINGTITTVQRTVGTTATKATVSGSAPDANRKRLALTPITLVGNIYIGGSGVTISNGKQIIGPDTIFLDWDASDYYLISDQPGNVVAIMEVV